MTEERFKIGRWRLIDIIFGEGICENCRKPITYLYFIEDERGNKYAVGSECFRQIVRMIPPRAREYIDLKERVLGNVDLVLKNKVQAVEYGRNLGARVEEPGLAVFGYPSVAINNRFYSATAIKIFFKTGRSREPKFDVEEETINELIRLGWKEYQAPRGAFGHVTDRFTVINPATAQELEKTLSSQGWTIYENPKKRYKLGYYERSGMETIGSVTSLVREAVEPFDKKRFTDMVRDRLAGREMEYTHILVQKLLKIKPMYIRDPEKYIDEKFILDKLEELRKEGVVNFYAGIPKIVPSLMIPANRVLIYLERHSGSEVNVREAEDIVIRLRELGEQLISAADRKDYALANEISRKKSELVRSYVDERIKKAESTLLPDEVILDYLKSHGMDKAGRLMLLHPRIAPRLRLHESVEIREIERLAGKPVAEMKAGEFYELYSIAHQIANAHAAPMLAAEEVIGRFNTEKEMLEKLRKAVRQLEEMKQKGLWEYGVKEKIIKPPRFRIVRFEKLPLEAGAICDRCGRCITWVYWLLDTEKSMKEEDAVPVGSECVKIITGRTPLQIRTGWKEYEAVIRDDLLEQERLKEAKEWRVINQDMIAGLERLAEGREHYLPIASSFLEAIAEYGTLTPKQLDLVKTLIDKSINLVGIDEHILLMSGLFTLTLYLRLGRYDSDFIRDVRNKAIDYGFTYKQRDSLLGILKKYSKQIQEIQPKLKSYEKQSVDKLMEYYKQLQPTYA